MALTIRSVLEIGKLASPLIGGAIRLFGGKRSRTIRTAVAVENALNRNPKKLTGAIAVVVAALGSWLFPEQWAQVVEFLAVYVKPALEALTADSQ